MTLSLLPKQSISHLEVLDTLLSKIENEFGLSEADLEERLKLAQKVNAIIEANIPGSYYNFIATLGSLYPYGYLYRASIVSSTDTEVVPASVQEGGLVLISLYVKIIKKEGSR